MKQRISTEWHETQNTNNPKAPQEQSEHGTPRNTECYETQSKQRTQLITENNETGNKHRIPVANVETQKNSYT